MTMMLIEGIKLEKYYEKNKTLPEPNKDKSNDEKALFKILKREILKNKKKFTNLSKDLKGISEETTTGVLWLK